MVIRRTPYVRRHTKSRHAAPVSGPVTVPCGLRLLRQRQSSARCAPDRTMCVIVSAPMFTRGRLSLTKCDIVSRYNRAYGDTISYDQARQHRMQPVDRGIPPQVPDLDLSHVQRPQPHDVRQANHHLALCPGPLQARRAELAQLPRHPRGTDCVPVHRARGVADTGRPSVAPCATRQVPAA